MSKMRRLNALTKAVNEYNAEDRRLGFAIKELLAKQDEVNRAILQREEALLKMDNAIHELKE